MKFFSTRKKLVATVSSVALAASLGGVAYAYFTSSGNGSGSATAGTSTAFTITPVTTTGPALTPTASGTGPSDTVTYTVNNPSSGAQELHSVVISVANADGTAWTAVSGCSASDFSVNGAAVGTAYTQTVNQDLAASSTYGNTVTLQLIDNSGVQDGCKLATVPLYLSAS
jgi:hypothetical protein